MVNVFPILFLAPLAHTILRVFVGLVYIALCSKHLKHRDTLKERFRFSFFPFPSFIVFYMAVIELVLGLMFFFGFYTQIAALISIIMCLKIIVMYKKFKGPFMHSRTFYTLLFAASFSLLITGAGVFAFDLPI